MAEREILLEQMLKVLKDIETNTCDKQFFPETNLLEKKLDRIIELHEKQIDLLKGINKDRCTCKKSKGKKTGKEKNEKKDKREKKPKKEI
ncbi:MAG TPA: hypothetical protein PKN12_00335 [Bacteroidales bacterium]|nr:hypothetical protein [Bacteroidales bacterium]HPT09004.1 hypothetical protein [Bacteroidales bacterium]